MTPLEDRHDRCPCCLGIEHLKQGLTEQACMNCSFATYTTSMFRPQLWDCVVTLHTSALELIYRMPPVEVGLSAGECEPLGPEGTHFVL